MDGKVIPSLSHLLAHGRPFCLRSAVLGSSHQCGICSTISDSCNSHGTQLQECVPQNVTVLPLPTSSQDPVTLSAADTANEPETTLQTTCLASAQFAASTPLKKLSTTNNLAFDLDTGSAYSWSISMATPSDPKPTTLGLHPVAASSPFCTSFLLPTSGSASSRVCGGSLSSNTYQTGSSLPPERVSRRKATGRIHKLEQSKLVSEALLPTTPMHGRHHKPHATSRRRLFSALTVATPPSPDAFSGPVLPPVHSSDLSMNSEDVAGDASTSLLSSHAESDTVLVLDHGSGPESVGGVQCTSPIDLTSKAILGKAELRVALLDERQGHEVTVLSSSVGGSVTLGVEVGGGAGALQSTSDPWRMVGLTCADSEPVPTELSPMAATANTPLVVRSNARLLSYALCDSALDANHSQELFGSPECGSHLPSTGNGLDPPPIGNQNGQDPPPTPCVVTCQLSSASLLEGSLGSADTVLVSSDHATLTPHCPAAHVVEDGRATPHGCAVGLGTLATAPPPQLPLTVVSPSAKSPDATDPPRVRPAPSPELSRGVHRIVGGADRRGEDPAGCIAVPVGCSVPPAQEGLSPSQREEPNGTGDMVHITCNPTVGSHDLHILLGTGRDCATTINSLTTPTANINDSNTVICQASEVVGVAATEKELPCVAFPQCNGQGHDGPGDHDDRPDGYVCKHKVNSEGALPEETGKDKLLELNRGHHCANRPSTPPPIDGVRGTSPPPVDAEGQKLLPLTKRLKQGGRKSTFVYPTGSAPALKTKRSSAAVHKSKNGMLEAVPGYPAAKRRCKGRLTVSSEVCQSHPLPVQTPPTHLLPVQAPPSPVQAPPSPVQAPPSPVQASPSPVQAPPSPVQASPSPVQAPPSPVQAPPSPVQAPPSPILIHVVHALPAQAPPTFALTAQGNECPIACLRTHVAQSDISCNEDVHMDTSERLPKKTLQHEPSELLSCQLTLVDQSAPQITKKKHCLIASCVKGQETSDGQGHNIEEPQTSYGQGHTSDAQGHNIEEPQTSDDNHMSLGTLYTGLVTPHYLGMATSHDQGQDTLHSRALGSRVSVQENSTSDDAMLSDVSTASPGLQLKGSSPPARKRRRLPGMRRGQKHLHVSLPIPSLHASLPITNLHVSLPVTSPGGDFVGDVCVEHKSKVSATSCSLSLKHGSNTLSNSTTLSTKIQEPIEATYNPCAGFCTASGRSISISAQALNRAKELVGEDMVTCSEDHLLPIERSSTRDKSTALLHSSGPCCDIVEEHASGCVPLQIIEPCHDEEVCVKAPPLLNSRVCVDQSFGRDLQVDKTLNPLTFEGHLGEAPFPSSLECHQGNEVPPGTSLAGHLVGVALPSTAHGDEAPPTTSSPKLPPQQNRHQAAAVRRRHSKVFKPPRSAASVSKEEEGASLERILGRFRASGAAPAARGGRMTARVGEGGGHGIDLVGAHVPCPSTLAGDDGALSPGVHSALFSPIAPHSTPAVGFVMASIKGLVASEAASEKVNSCEASMAMGGGDTGEVECIGTGGEAPAHGQFATGGIEFAVTISAGGHATTKKSMKVDEDAFSVAVGGVQTVGFQTASGKALTISSEALKKAQSLMHAVGEQTIPSPGSIPGIQVVGFQTASGKNLSVSSEALKKAQSLMDALPEQTIPSPGSVARVQVVGFQTASGKNLSVSSEALKKAQSLMDALPEQTIPSPGSVARVQVVGFQTASGKNLIVSSEALKKAQSLMDALPEQTIPSPGSIPGVQIDSSLDMYVEAVSVRRTPLGTPRGTLDTPRGTLDTPRGTLDTPRGTLDTPRGTLDTPRGTLDTAIPGVEVLLATSPVHSDHLLHRQFVQQPDLQTCNKMEVSLASVLHTQRDIESEGHAACRQAAIRSTSQPTSADCGHCVGDLPVAEMGRVFHTGVEPVSPSKLVEGPLDGGGQLELLGVSAIELDMDDVGLHLSTQAVSHFQDFSDEENQSNSPHAVLPLEGRPSPSHTALPLEGRPSPSHTALPLEGRPSPSHAALPSCSSVSTSKDGTLQHSVEPQEAATVGPLESHIQQMSVQSHMTVGVNDQGGCSVGCGGLEAVLGESHATPSEKVGNVSMKLLDLNESLLDEMFDGFEEVCKGDQPVPMTISSLRRGDVTITSPPCMGDITMTSPPCMGDVTTTSPPCMGDVTTTSPIYKGNLDPLLDREGVPCDGEAISMSASMIEGIASSCEAGLTQQEVSLYHQGKQVAELQSMHGREEAAMDGSLEMKVPRSLGDDAGLVDMHQARGQGVVNDLDGRTLAEQREVCYGGVDLRMEEVGLVQGVERPVDSKEVLQRSWRLGSKEWPEGDDLMRPPQDGEVEGLEEEDWRGIKVSGNDDMATFKGKMVELQQAVTKPSFPSFMTAGGKMVEVQQSSLEAVRENLGSVPKPSFPSFMTAGGKMVEVQQSSLEAVRERFHLDLPGSLFDDCVGVPMSDGPTTAFFANPSGTPDSASKHAISGGSPLQQLPTELQPSAGVTEAFSSHSYPKLAEESAEPSTSTSSVWLQNAQREGAYVSEKAISGARERLGACDVIHSEHIPKCTLLAKRSSAHTPAVHSNDSSLQPCVLTPGGGRGGGSSSVRKEGERFKPVFKACTGGTRPNSKQMPTPDTQATYSRTVPEARGLVSSPEATLCDGPRRKSRKPLVTVQEELFTTELPTVSLTPYRDHKPNPRRSFQYGVEGDTSYGMHVVPGTYSNHHHSTPSKPQPSGRCGTQEGGTPSGRRKLHDGGTIPQQPTKEEGTRTLPSPKLDVSTYTKSEPMTPPPLPLLSTSTPHRTKSSGTLVPTPYEDGILSPITLSQVTFLELSMQCADDHAPTMSDKVLPDFGLRELTEQDLKEFSDCTTLDTSLCTASASLGASARGEASYDNTETESATLHNVSAGFVPLKYHDSTSPPVTYRGTHDDVPRPSVFHFPGPHSIPSSVSRRSQMGTLLDAKLKHPHHRVPLDRAVCGERPGCYDRHQLASLGVCPSAVGVTADTAGSYRFAGSHHFSEGVQAGVVEVCVGDGAMLKVGSDGYVGTAELWDAFSRSPGVDPTLISPEWFSNHYQWVVWKLAAMEVSFPHWLAGRCLTPDWLMLQMKYRYDREIDRAQRPALRKICERDDVASRTMVLCVSHIDYDLLALDQTQASFANDSKAAASSPDPPCVRLTDGWYSLPGVLDAALKHAVKRGVVRVGTKVITSGAELVGSAGPCHPLEAPPTLALKLFANSTRRVRWYARLGYHRSPVPFHVLLTSVLPTGGLVGNTKVLVCRVYPLVFMERGKDRGTVFRSRRAEEQVEASHQAKRQHQLEKVYQRVQQEMEDEVASAEGKTSRRRSRRLTVLQDKKQLTSHDAEEVYEAFMSAADPHQFQESLSPAQLTLLEGHRQTLAQERQAELQRRVAQAIADAEDTLAAPREVVPLLKLRVVSPTSGTSDNLGCILCIWRPSEDMRETLKEGKAFRLFNVVASPGHAQLPCRLHLTATKSTRYQELSVSSDNIYTPRNCTSISELGSYPLPYGEFDTVGVVMSVTSSSPSGREDRTPSKKVDSVHLANAAGNILVISVWNGLESQGLQDVVVPGAVVGVSNLTYRGTYSLHPTAYAGDLSLFTLHPQEHLKAPWEELNKSLPINRTDMLQTLQSNIVVEY